MGLIVLAFIGLIGWLVLSILFALMGYFGPVIGIIIFLLLVR